MRDISRVFFPVCCKFCSRTEEFRDFKLFRAQGGAQTLVFVVELWTVKRYAVHLNVIR